MSPRLLVIVALAMTLILGFSMSFIIWLLEKDIED